MVNKAILIGNLGKDPEVRFTQTGTSVCTFSLATNERWTGKEGNKEERTEWHRIVVWGKLAELCGEYLSKGRTVYIEGRIQTRDWSDKEGNKRYTTEIVANNVQFLGGGPGKTGTSPFNDPGPQNSEEPPSAEKNEGPEDDIPF